MKNLELAGLTYLFEFIMSLWRNATEMDSKKTYATEIDLKKAYLNGCLVFDEELETIVINEHGC